MTTMISIDRSNLINTELALPMSPIKSGDTLRITNFVKCTELNGSGLEVFVFEKINEECEFTQLSLSQLLHCKGSVGYAIRRGIANGDLHTVADIMKLFDKHSHSIRCSSIDDETRVRPNGEYYKHLTYKFDWI